MEIDCIHNCKNLISKGNAQNFIKGGMMINISTSYASSNIDSILLLWN